MASRFWVGGTGTWDSSTTTHWAASSGGAGGQSVPGSADTVTFDSNSGGGTVTLNFGGTITILSLTIGTFTGTFDNSVNNNNITLSANAGFNGSGTGTRTVKLGTATYTLTSVTASWNWATTTNLTFDGSSANVVFTGATGLCSLNGGNLSHGNITFGTCSGSGRYNISGSNTFASVAISAGAVLQLSTTTAISNAFNWVGTSSSPISLMSSSLGSQTNIAAAAGSVAQWCAVRDLSFTGSPIATSSFDLGNNSGITITPPGSGGGFGVIGG